MRKHLFRPLTAFIDAPLTSLTPLLTRPLRGAASHGTREPSESRTDGVLFLLRIHGPWDSEVSRPGLSARSAFLWDHGLVVALPVQPPEPLRTRRRTSRPRLGPSVRRRRGGPRRPAEQGLLRARHASAPGVGGHLRNRRARLPPEGAPAASERAKPVTAVPPGTRAPSVSTGRHSLRHARIPCQAGHAVRTVSGFDAYGSDRGDDLSSRGRWASTSGASSVSRAITRLRAFGSPPRAVGRTSSQAAGRRVKVRAPAWRRLMSSRSSTSRLSRAMDASAVASSSSRSAAVRSTSGLRSEATAAQPAAREP